MATDIRSAYADSDTTLARLARRQFGAFTREQACHAGFAPRTVDARLARGVWRVLHPSVYSAAGTPASDPLRAVAARLHYGPRTHFSHYTAAALHGIDVRPPDSRVWITTPLHVSKRRRPGVARTRSTQVQAHAVSVSEQPVLNVARTMVDLAGVLDESTWLFRLYDVVRRGQASPEDVLAAAECLRPRKGTALVSRCLERFHPDYDSGLEAEAGQHLAAAGIHLQPQLEVWDGPLLVARLDFGDEELRVGIEIDGDRYHSSKQARSRGLRRDRAVRRLGWLIEHFDADDVHRGSADFVRRVRELITEASSRRSWAQR